jgi:hypothetical protein
LKTWCLVDGLMSRIGGVGFFDVGGLGRKLSRFGCGNASFCILVLWKECAWSSEGVGELGSGRRRERWSCRVRELGSWGVRELEVEYEARTEIRRIGRAGDNVHSM